MVDLTQLYRWGTNVHEFQLVLTLFHMDDSAHDPYFPDHFTPYKKGVNWSDYQWAGRGLSCWVRPIKSLIFQPRGRHMC